jgi:hypothetical protein
MKFKKPIFKVLKESDKESTGSHSIHNEDDFGLFLSQQKESISDFCSIGKDNDFIVKSDEISLTHDLFSRDDFNPSFGNTENFILKKSDEINKLFLDFNFLNENTFEKERNNINNDISEEKEKPKDDTNSDLMSNKNTRCDSLLIKFKAILGKWFINNINNKLKLLQKDSIIKRRIKFYAFNYKKFTLKVSYSQNKEWLKYKMIDLLLIGDEENQIKNKKGIKTLFKKNLVELEEIKDMLQSTYEVIVKQFYLSEEFQKFKNNKRVKELDLNFEKIMKMSLLENFGFIKFFETRKGNNRKES